MFTVAFNGPPKSGKDTAGGILLKILSSASPILTNYNTDEVHHLEFKTKMIKLFMLSYGITEDQFIECSLPANKSVQFDYLDGESYRSGMIKIAKMYRSNFGENYFNETLVKFIDQKFHSKTQSVNIITDLGSDNELKDLEDLVDKHNQVFESWNCDKSFKHKLILIRVFKPDVDFRDDIRSYVDSTNENTLVIDLHNNNTLGYYEKQVKSLAQHLGFFHD